ncbi:SDR family oxidoreductase [Pararobbsia silviterrae]|uniref:SDR family oxidoreductase n=1 Tax=Pararobbsia silviterrae TaxID=1792498 RepID=A0A494XNA3_9BURK|nr:SDR family oxidoreductase [Pararobbsia silviterrae]RKP49589.1 SDR family oxidoreductase [Pararobbsia silviterrae]
MNTQNVESTRTERPHAVVMGGTSGIGLATAQRLHASGMRVTVTGRDAARLDTARIAIGGDAYATPLDASDADAVKAFFAHIGPFDHLVLALGGGKGFGPFRGLPIDDVLGGFTSKTLPHFACAQAALGTIRERGSITFVTAVSAQMASPGTAGLAAVNGAISCAVPTLAVELRPLRVNAVSPGVVDTPWWDALPADQRAAALAGFAEKAPAGRVGTPDDIAKTLAFLIDNSFMTGQTVICDGGLSLV